MKDLYPFDTWILPDAWDFAHKYLSTNCTDSVSSVITDKSLRLFITAGDAVESWIGLAFRSAHACLPILVVYKPLILNRAFNI